jgi:hypothetical protein
VSGVSSVIPVVGQALPRNQLDPAAAVPRDVLAQQLETEGPHDSGKVFSRQQSIPGIAMTGEGVGYQPVQQTRNLGALLQVTPSVDVTRKGVVLDLRSLVVRQEAQPGQPVEFRNVVPLDRLNVVVQQFMTTLHMPLGEPRLIAGSTLEPFAKENASPQLYLVVEVNLSNPEREADAATVAPEQGTH